MFSVSAAYLYAMPPRRNFGTQTSPSGRGTAVPAHFPGKYKQDYSDVSMPVGTPGMTGMPSMEPSVNASRYMQNVVTDEDDIEYYASIAGNAPYDTERFYVSKTMPITTNSRNKSGAMNFKEENEEDDSVTESLARLITMMINEQNEEDDEKEELEEFSAVGGIAGYTLPLGMGARKAKRRVRR